MSFAGNLEDLAIVDVIQLLHSTRKSGTLCVIGDKGRSQIVFNNGFIVCANHYNASVRIGKILVEMEAVTQQALDQALAEQQSQGEDKKPLIGLLIENQAIEKDVAYKGLECLIEMTIVEMVSWQKGTFTLDVDRVEINDEYRYIPEKLQQELSFDTQMVLMDALRIYDEKRASGDSLETVADPDQTESEVELDSQPAAIDLNTADDLSADILGLDSLDQLDTHIPEAFSGLEAFDPSEMHRQKVREILPDFPSSQREELVVYLTEKSNITENKENVDPKDGRTVLLYGSNELVQHGVLSACKHAGIMVFTASNSQELESKLAQSVERGLQLTLVFDCPVATIEGFTKDEITGLRLQIRQQYPNLQIVQLASPVDYLYSLQALSSGANTVLPRSMAENRRDTFIQDFIQFLESFPVFIQGLPTSKDGSATDSGEILKELRQMQSASEISFFLLERVSEVFERSMILILRKGELFAEKSFGIESDRSEGPSDPLRFKISIETDSLLEKIVNSGDVFFDSVEDKALREAIFGEISAPDKSKILLLPINAAGRTIALIYADYGQSPALNIDLDSLESFAWLSGLALEQVLRNRG